MKKQDGYELNRTQNSEKVEYKFKSVGNKGSIDKIIEFHFMYEKRWNLGFGDVKDDDWEDNVISDNNDLRKILQTVANAVHLFFNDYPDREIAISPLDYQRKLLYNRLFQQRWHEINPIFTVKAIIFDTQNTEFEDYNPKKIFDYFIIKLKNDIAES